MQSKDWKDPLSGAIGFSLAGILAPLLAIVLFRLLPLGSLIESVGQTQPLIALLWKLFLALSLLVAVGAIQGLINGYTLSRIDPLASQRRYLLAGAVSTGLIYAPLVLVFTLLAALISIFNNNADVSVRGFVIFFGIFGILNGLLFGLLVGLISVGWRHFWRYWLAALGGYTLGGILLGLSIWLAARADAQHSRLLGILAVIGILVGMPALAGAALGWTAGWFDRRRQAGAALPVSMGRSGKIALAVVGIILAAGALLLATRLTRFVTIKPGSLSTQLASQTTGVAWTEPSSLAQAQVVPGSDASLAIDEAGSAALVWVQPSGETSDIYLSVASLDSRGVPLEWSAPVNVSNSPGIDSSHPQLVAVGPGDWRLAWSEPPSSGGGPAEILYSRCQGGSCSQPARLSDLSGPACASAAPGQAQDWRETAPGLATDADGSLMVVWQAGENLLYTIWPAEDTPPVSPQGCLPNPGGAAVLSGPPALAGGAPGSFSLAFSSEPEGAIYQAEYRAGKWQAVSGPLGQGGSPALTLDSGGQTHLAWCANDGVLIYHSPQGSQETIAPPACDSQPALSQGGDGRLHLAWHAAQVENAAGTVKPEDLLYESIRGQSGWTPAAIVDQTAQSVRPDLALDPQGNLLIAWADGDLFTSSQPHYDCSDGQLDPTSQAILGVLHSGKYRPADEAFPYCHNQFIGLYYTPNPIPGLPETPTLNGAYDNFAEAVENARYEVLFTVMEYVADANSDSPGFVLSDAIVHLYERVKANPQDYPRGMTVRILLGNYPEISSFEWGNQIWHVLQDLKDAGLPTMNDTELGWVVEVANFDGQFPHSHTKFLVVDGSAVAAAGYNYSYLHLSDLHPSGQGIDLVDLAMAITGPAAQASQRAFDDMWEGANQAMCPDLEPTLGRWELACDFTLARATHVPEVLRYYLPPDDDVGFSLFRNTNYHESDEAVVAAIRSADQSLDVWEVNFSLQIQCVLGLVIEDLCTFDNALPWMAALVDTVVQNGVKTRVMVTDVNMNGMENRVAIEVMQAELARRGVSDLVEFRYLDGRMHAKSLLVDQQLLIVGSQNFHYSAYGDSGLAEYNLATNDPGAIQEYQQTFDYYWEQAKPIE